MRKTGWQARYGRESKKGGFCIFRHDFIDSLAFKSMSASSLQVYILLKRCFNGSNNGEIHLSCREISKKANISKNTAVKAFRELQAKGIITQKQEGNFIDHMAAIWKLNTDKNKGENRPSDEWKNWKPGMDLTQT